MPCPGTWRRTSVYSYRGSALMASFFIEAYTLTNRPLSSYYAGLSFKSGYQQTGYIHPILSYYDVKYYYCLVLGAWCLVLGAWSLECVFQVRGNTQKPRVPLNIRLGLRTIPLVKLDSPRFSASYATIHLT